MRNLLLRLSALAVAITIAGSAHAQVNLSWGNCGTNGTQDQVFACNTNTGSPFTLFGSFISPDASQCVAIEAVVDFMNTDLALQDWWKFNTGECRAGGFNGNYDFTSGPFECVDFWQGQSIGVQGSITNGAGLGANTLRYKLVTAIPAASDMDPGQEIYGFKINILRTRTVGTGSCAGCADGACFVLNSILVNQPAGVGDILLTGAAPGGRDFATWQGGLTSLCTAVPNRNRTWGQVKALYR